MNGERGTGKEKKDEQRHREAGPGLCRESSSPRAGLGKGHGVSSVIGKQVLRAGTSIGANLHEARGSQSRADFISKCSIACKEAHETLCWLDLIVASNLMEERQLAGLAQECDELVAILTAIVKKSKGQA